MKKFLPVLFAVLLMVGCTGGQSEKPAQNEISSDAYDLARYISGHTAGEVKPTDPIVVRFTDNMVGKDMIDQPDERIKIIVTPVISGKAIWQQQNELVFRPDKAFKPGKEYAFAIDIRKLIDAAVSIKPFQFQVQVMNQEILEFQGDFTEMPDQDNFLSYKGSLKFLLPVEIDEVEKAAILKIKNQQINLNWQGAGTLFSFESDSFERLAEKVKIDFHLDKKILEMKDDFARESSLFSLHEMAVVLVKRLHEQENPGLEIEFSEPLAADQDVSGYIYLEPSLEYKLKKLENKILLNGDFDFGKNYDITIRKGILNKSDIALQHDYFKSITFNDESPQIVFAQSGCFLPSGNEQKI
ncbi:MAG TPA: hypothetical protein PLD62_11590, partial [Candidatus Cloacimonadota bacterium]|nr:hypothetical protein [Candidatus Cloacimonadota bacterium]